MLVDKLHTLYIPLSDILHDELFKLYKTLSIKYKNQYLDEKNFSAHLTIGTLILQDSKTEDFISVCSSLLSNVSPFKINFFNFVTGSSNKYIFLGLDDSSKERLILLRENFLDKMQSVNKVEIPQKYMDNWDSYSQREKNLLKKTGSPYEYNPHVSIVKLDPNDMPEALNFVQSFTISEKTFVADTFVISRQSENPDNQFPILKKIKI